MKPYKITLEIDNLEDHKLIEQILTGARDTTKRDEVVDYITKILETYNVHIPHPNDLFNVLIYTREKIEKL